MIKIQDLKRAVVSVINDLVTDRRVDKTCITLEQMGFSVLLVGRIKHDSPELSQRTYKTHRMRLFFEKGPLFYAEYNIRLFLFLIFRRVNLLFSNDLDTLLPNYIIHRIKRIPLIYDSHEYFTETPELVNRKYVQGIWKLIEKKILPKIKDCITVNESIASLYEKEFGIRMAVVRNIPPLYKAERIKSKKDLGLPEGKKIVILQGSGINIQRGAEELVESMKFTGDIILLIVGGGDIIASLKEMSKTQKLDQKIIFIPRVPFEELFNYTVNADVGITIDKDTNINYRYSLPNKIFDYINAGIPIIASRLPEVQKIIDQYDIGTFIDNHNPGHIASVITATLNDAEKLERWKENIKFARKELNWENERLVLIDTLKKHA